MRILRNHFKGNNTIIINGRIINGCLNFTPASAEEILTENEISNLEWEEILGVYTDEKDSEESVAQFLNDPDWEIRKCLAEHGFGLDILVNDPDDCVKRAALCSLNPWADDPET